MAVNSSALHAPPFDRIVVHPASDLTYASHVIEGLSRLLGESAIQFSTRGFPHSYGGGRVLALYLAARPDARLYLSLADQGELNPGGLEWASAYGMVNIPATGARVIGFDDRPRTLPGEHVSAGPSHERPADAAGSGRDGADAAPLPAVHALGPTFGVRLSSNRLTARHIAQTWRWAAEGPETSPSRRRRTRMAYERSRALARHQRTRVRADRYVVGRSDPDYVFYAASTYPQFPEVNAPRVRFVRACRLLPGLTFEGGFVPHPRDPAPGVEPVAERRYQQSDYMARVQRSVVTFNNPAVKGCLGWKLGEQLALGKAIVTTPIEKALPAPLTHGEHVHIVDGSVDSMVEAIELLRTDHDYRHHLETNARAWFDSYLEPTRLAARLLALLDR